MTSNKVFFSTKTYEHNVGLSACFRQWKAESHCRFMHGYALKVQLTFAAVKGLDVRNWVVDFGGLKPIKAWLEANFDHKTLVAKDDPEIGVFQDLHARGIIDMVLVDAVGCERFAEMIFDHVDAWLRSDPAYRDRVVIASVEVREHEGNSAVCARAANVEDFGKEDL